MLSESIRLENKSDAGVDPQPRCVFNKRRKNAVSIEKMTRQTRPRAMTLMTLIHLRTVIVDVDDARIRNI